jgi:lipoyl-dependent peroxiredoxin
MKPHKILYQAVVTAEGGRDGSARAADGSFQIALSVPRELGGPGGSGTNPEQLFAAGYAACFLGAVKLVARSRKIVMSAEPSVTARVGIGPIDLGYALAVELITSLPGVDAEYARSVIEDAHARCPYSNATRGNVDVLLTLA